MRYFAAYYLRQWLTLERNFHELFVAGNVEADRLREFADKYEFSRTIRQLGIRRDDPDPCCEILANHINGLFAAPNPAGFVANHANVLLELQNVERKHKQIISGLSKIYWMKFRDNIVIYDQKVLAALENPLNGYLGYCKAFDAAFRAYGAEISAACHWLKGSDYVARLVHQGATTQQNVNEWCGEQWFQRRVLDMYLFFNRSEPSGIERANFLSDTD